MEYKNDDMKLRFTVPDRPTVRQQLEYIGATATRGGKDFFLALWRGAQVVLDEWECKLIPDAQKVDLEKASDPKQTEIITWVGMTVWQFMNSLDDVPKN